MRSKNSDIELTSGQASGVRHFLLVGLGNYTHPLTRHSVGQVILEGLARRLNAPLSYDRSVQGWTSRATVDVLPPSSKAKGKGNATPQDLEMTGPEQVQFTLLKPKLLMNISGKSVGAAVRANKLPLSSVIVIHDSLEHTPFRISSKFGGSANGHNGVRSTIDAVGGKDFHRLRIGIGRGNTDVADYVLEGLSEQEALYWSNHEGKGVEEVWSAIERIVTSK